MIAIPWPGSARRNKRFPANGRTLDGEHRLNNGAVYKVAGRDLKGNIRFTNGWTIAADYCFLTHGYVTTSFASQGKTVDHVMLAESSMSFPAGSQEQFYVLASRGRRQCTIYTDDSDMLKEAVASSSQKLSATELLGECRRRRKRHDAIMNPPAPPAGAAATVAYGR